MLRSYKEIAERVSKIWGCSIVSVPSVVRWSKLVKDPLPLRRIKPRPDGIRSIIVAETAAVERWAQRRIT